jgi:hypothetical protein
MIGRDQDRRVFRNAAGEEATGFSFVTKYRQNIPRQFCGSELRKRAGAAIWGIPHWRIACRFPGLTLQPFNALTTQ